MSWKQVHKFLEWVHILTLLHFFVFLGFLAGWKFHMHSEKYAHVLSSNYHRWASITAVIRKYLLHTDRKKARPVLPNLFLQDWYASKLVQSAGPEKKFDASASFRRSLVFTPTQCWTILMVVGTKCSTFSWNPCPVHLWCQLNILQLLGPSHHDNILKLTLNWNSKLVQLHKTFF